MKKFNIKSILEGAIKSKPIKVTKGKTRLEIEFFKESDFNKPLNPISIHKILSEATESITLKKHVCFPKPFHSSLK
jgi:hypothetical protein